MRDNWFKKDVVVILVCQHLQLANEQREFSRHIVFSSTTQCRKWQLNSVSQGLVQLQTVNDWLTSDQEKTTCSERTVLTVTDWACTRIMQVNNEKSVGDYVVIAIASTNTLRKRQKKHCLLTYPISRYYISTSWWNITWQLLFCRSKYNLVDGRPHHNFHSRRLPWY